MQVEKFVQKIKELGITTLAGVPDSALKPFCDYVNRIEKNAFFHYVPANEGSAVGIAIGEYLATGKPACVYMQNSGIGNIVNPITSLANKEVYNIPMLMLIGFRGEPNKKDEPQHKFMGKITEDILEVLEIKHTVLSKEMSDEEITIAFSKAQSSLEENRQFAFVIKKDFFDTSEENVGAYKNQYQLVREDAIAEIISSIKEEDILISTTGKISREVYEQSDKIKGQHAQDFLTVGGMGHTSMIALGIAKEKSDKRVYCLDGDGAIFMHMGSMAFLAKQSPSNLVHICFNNEAHESVGGMPTGIAGFDYSELAKACGYQKVYKVETANELNEVLETVKLEQMLTFIEIKVSVDSRSDLGRPKETAEENKNNFMKYHGVNK